MDRSLYLKQAIALLFAMLLVGCHPGGTEIPPTPYPAEVEWETAVELLNSGAVEMVVQEHSLNVMLTMNDGSVIKTVEPTIDAIFAEIEMCGAPCRQITRVTE